MLHSSVPSFKVMHITHFIIGLSPSGVDFVYILHECIKACTVYMHTCIHETSYRSRYSVVYMLLTCIPVMQLQHGCRRPLIAYLSLLCQSSSSAWLRIPFTRRRYIRHCSGCCPQVGGHWGPFWALQGPYNKLSLHIISCSSSRSVLTTTTDGK